MVHNLKKQQALQLLSYFTLSSIHKRGGGKNQLMKVFGSQVEWRLHFRLYRS